MQYVSYVSTYGYFLKYFRFVIKIFISPFGKAEGTFSL